MNIKRPDIFKTSHNSLDAIHLSHEQQLKPQNNVNLVDNSNAKLL